MPPKWKLKLSSQSRLSVFLPNTITATRSVPVPLPRRVRVDSPGQRVGWQVVAALAPRVCISLAFQFEGASMQQRLVAVHT